VIGCDSRAVRTPGGRSGASTKNVGERSKGHISAELVDEHRQCIRDASPRRQQPDVRRDRHCSSTAAWRQRLRRYALRTGDTMLFTYSASHPNGFAMRSFELKRGATSLSVPPLTVGWEPMRGGLVLGISVRDEPAQRLHYRRLRRVADRLRNGDGRVDTARVRRERPARVRARTPDVSAWRLRPPRR
jgi:hypothetical protein